MSTNKLTTYMDHKTINVRYKIIKCQTDFDFRIYKFKKSYTFEELKPQIADAFYKGVKWVRLYSDGRKVNSFLEIKKDDFDPLFIEKSYVEIQIERQLNKKFETIKILKSNIAYKKNLISEIMLEIKNLQDLIKTQ